MTKRPIWMTRGTTGLLSLGLVLVLSGCEIQTTSGGGSAAFQPAVAKLLESAKTLSDSGDKAGALCRLTAAADLAPNAYQVHYNMGTLYADQHQWNAAITSLNRALEIQPDNADALYTLGMAFHGMGDDLRRAAYAEPDTPPDELGLPPEFQNITRPQAHAMAVESYQKALASYEQFLKVAEETDPGRKEMENAIPAVQQKLERLQSEPPQT